MSRPYPLITIDGPAGVGKSTLARTMADILQIPFMDTGAMFRCLALYLGEKELPPEEISARGSEVKFELTGGGRKSALLCNGKPIGDEIRTEKVGMMAARLAAIPEVREILLKAQRDLGKSTALVAEGRDMGTVVFPEANFKFFLDATPEVRAYRRYLELKQKDEKPELTAITEQIRKRDSLDRHRAIAPLKPAKDAFIIDTSNLDIEGVLGAMMHQINITREFGERSE